MCFWKVLPQFIETYYSFYLLNICKECIFDVEKYLPTSQKSESLLDNSKKGVQYYIYSNAKQKSTPKNNTNSNKKIS